MQYDFGLVLIAVGYGWLVYGAFRWLRERRLIAKRLARLVGPR